MNIATATSKTCWCGNTHLLPFNPSYARCDACGTLVSLEAPPPGDLLVKDDETDFYGKQYWLQHQTDNLGFGDIQSRVRRDLAERNLHWLQTLLKYCPPPARTLELGCAHGSFVALMQQSGYSTSGIEMSPWVVDFAKKTFGIRVALGPVEEAGLPDGELDAIVLMDVLEHLPDPLGTMKHCLRLLKPGGFLLIQTPQFREDVSYEKLVSDNDRFLEMLIPNEHIYLFSTRSAASLFERLGAPFIRFEAAIFAHYDMFFAVSRSPLPTTDEAAVESALLRTPGGRMTLAMLDLRGRECALAAQLGASEQDRSDRAGQIERLNLLLRESDVDRAARAEQIKTLTALLVEAEQDRAARGEQITTLTRTLLEAEQDRSARGEQIQTLTALIRAAEQARQDLGK
jgi:2-polyprenyl-3-methyl-5-hydroxy-6-metoxy-1,4-benzoquinol methylase